MSKTIKTLSIMLSVFTVLAMIVGVIADLLGIYTFFGPKPTSTPFILATEQPTPTPLPDLKICDDFNDDFIDNTQWALRGDATIIAEQNNVLNFEVTSQSSNGIVWAAIAAEVPSGTRVKEIAYETILESFRGKKYGVAGLDLSLGDDRLITIPIGVGKDGPLTDLSICPTSDAAYADCFRPKGPNIALGVPFDVSISHIDSGIKIFINDILQHTVFSEAPIVRWQFYLYGDQNSMFHVTIDNVCASYGET